MPSSQHAWVEFSLLLIMVSRSAWQSVSISIGCLHVISENLSKLYFRAVNLRRYGWYLVSASDVHLDANLIGCVFVWVFPQLSVQSKHCDKMPANPSLQPSVVMMNGDPSYFGPLTTRALVSAVFNTMNAFACIDDHCPSNRWDQAALWYICFPLPFGTMRVFAKSLRGFSKSE